MADRTSSAEIVAREVVDAAVQVHKELGPGLLESVYEVCLAEELQSRTLRIDRQHSLPVIYKGKPLDVGFRVDLIVENLVLIELKTVEKIMPIHEAQILTYLRMSRLKLGFLMNFNVPLMRDGLRRFVL